MAYPNQTVDPFLAGKLRRQAILDAGARQLLSDLKSFRGNFASSMAIQVEQGSRIYGKALDILVRMLASKRAQTFGCSIEEARVSVMQDLDNSRAQNQLGWPYWERKAAAREAAERSRPPMRMGA